MTFRDGVLRLWRCRRNCINSRRLHEVAAEGGTRLQLGMWMGLPWLGPMNMNGEKGWRTALFVFENFNFSVQVFKFHAGHYLI
jgi:hypothetical protein